MRHSLFHHTKRWYIKTIEHEFTPFLFCLLVSAILFVAFFHVQWHEESPQTGVQFAAASTEFPYEPVIVQNVGQLQQDDIAFYVAYGDHDILFYNDAIVYQSLEEGIVTRYTQKYAAATTRKIRGRTPSDIRVRHYAASIPTSTLPTYESIVYEELYPGIDLEVALEGKGIKFSYIVSPGADPTDIAMEFPDGVSIGPDGGLLIGNTVPIHTPVSFQFGASINTQFVFATTNTVQFELLDPIDPTELYIIDPYVDFLTQGTFLGGTGQDARTYIAIDDDTQTVYAVGELRSRPYDPTPGTFGEGYSSSGWDHGVVKFSPQLDSIEAITYIGGDEGNQIRAMVYEPHGSIIYLAGFAQDDFPVTDGAVDTEYTVDPDGTAYSGREIGIARVASDLTLEAATLLGGSDSDQVEALSLDEDNNLIVVGSTASSDFVTTSASFVGTHPSPGNETGFVTRLSPMLTSVEASTYFGGTGNSSMRGAIELGGVYYVGATVENTDYAATNTVFTTTVGGGQDIVIMALPESFATPTAMMRLGGAGADYLSGIRKINNALYIFGSTNAPGLSASTESSVAFANGYQNTAADSSAAYVMKLSTDLTSITNGTYIDGGGSDGLFDVTLCGNDLVFGGYTNSTNFPEATLGYQSSFAGGTFDGVVGILSMDLTTLSQSSYIGGTNIEIVRSVACDGLSTVYAAGGTKSNSFTFDSGFQTTNAGDYDWFIARYFTTPPTITIGATSTILQEIDGTVDIPVTYVDASESTSLILTYTTTSCSGDLEAAVFATSTIAADSALTGTVDVTASTGYHITDSGTPGVTSTGSFTWVPSLDISYDGTLCIAATVSDGASRATAYVSSTIDTLAPTTPGDITILATSTTGVTIQFSTTSLDTNFETYRLYYAFGSTTLESFEDVSYIDYEDISLFASSSFAGATSTFVSLPVSNVQYTLRFVARDSYGNESTGTSRIITTLPPVIPTSVSTESLDTDQVTLSWSGETNNTTTAYLLSYSPPTTTLATTTETSQTIEDVTCASTYAVWLSVFDLFANIVSTTNHSFTTAACPDTSVTQSGGGGGSFSPPATIDTSSITARIVEALNGVVSSASVTIAISGLPDTLTEIAIASTPDFASIGWQPINRDTGTYLYTLQRSEASQVIYIRFRAADGGITDIPPLQIRLESESSEIAVPAAPTMLVPDRIAPYRAFRVTGVGLPDATITLTIGSIAYRVDTDAAGKYMIEVLSQLAPGQYTLAVRQRSRTGGPESEILTKTIMVAVEDIIDAETNTTTILTNVDEVENVSNTDIENDVLPIQERDQEARSVSVIPTTTAAQVQTSTQPLVERSVDTVVPEGNTPFFLLYDSTNANYRRDQVTGVTMLPRHGIDVYVRPATTTKSITARMYSRSSIASSNTVSATIWDRVKAVFMPTVWAETGSIDEQSDRTMVQGYLFEKDTILNAYSGKISLPEDTAPGIYDLVVTINEEQGGKTHIETSVTIPEPGRVISAHSGTIVKTARVQLYQVLEDGQLTLWRDGLQVQKNPQFVDLSGGYTFKLPKGTYVLVADAPGYASYQSIPLEVSDAEILSQNVILTPQYGAWEWFWNLVRKILASF